MANERYTTAQVIEELKKAQGVKAHAAELLGCDRRTVDNYINRHPTVAAAYHDLRETMVDRAERGLLKKLIDEEWAAIKYVLSTLGKDRGYAQKYEIDALIRNLDLSKMSDSQLDRLATGEGLIDVLATPGTG